MKARSRMEGYTGEMSDGSEYRAYRHRCHCVSVTSSHPRNVSDVAQLASTSPSLPRLPTPYHHPAPLFPASASPACAQFPLGLSLDNIVHTPHITRELLPVQSPWSVKCFLCVHRLCMCVCLWVLVCDLWWLARLLSLHVECDVECAMRGINDCIARYTDTHLDTSCWNEISIAIEANIAA